MTDTIDLVADIRHLLAARGRDDVPAAVAHLSLFGVHSCVGAYEPGGLITPLIEFLALPVRGADLLEEIRGIDENAPRLVDNYATAFPDAVRGIEAMGADLDDLETPALGWLFLACRTALSLDRDDPPSAGSTDTVKVDTVVIEEDGRYLFDGRRLLRSLMSYRIAGVSPPALARSVSESMGEFVADAVDRLVRQWPEAQTIACAGDVLTTDQVLRSRARAGLAALGRLALFAEQEAELQPT